MTTNNTAPERAESDAERDAMLREAADLARAVEWHLIRGDSEENAYSGAAKMLAAVLSDRAAALAARAAEIERLGAEIEDWRGRLATQCGETLAARYERDRLRAPSAPANVGGQPEAGMHAIPPSFASTAPPAPAEDAGAGTTNGREDAVTGSVLDQNHRSPPASLPASGDNASSADADAMERARQVWCELYANGAYQDGPATDNTRFEIIAAAIRAAEARAYERASKLCAARAIEIRDNGPQTSEGLLTAIAGAAMGAWFNAESAIRALAATPGEKT